MAQSRVLVMGDVHGAYKALLQVLERCAFDFDNDKLIFLGDVADGWPEVRECIDLLLKIKKRIILRGNHDQWFYDWVHTGWCEGLWLRQGGRATVESYRGNPWVPQGALHEVRIPDKHMDFLKNSVLWHQEGNKVFCHAGFESHHPMQDSDDNLMWNRTLWYEACRLHMNWEMSCRELKRQGKDPKPYPRITNFDEVYIGHTSTSREFLEPQKRCEIWNMDQGAGWEGKLSIMDIETKEFWQSDMVKELYPNVKGRG
jgi:serine/threonine protein phosphatase 1